MEKRVQRRKRLQRNIWYAADRLFLICVFLLLASIIVIQVAMFFMPEMGTHLNTALRLEGKPLDTEELVAAAGNVSGIPWAVLGLKMLDYASRPEVKVLIDGREAGSFIQSEVTINVKHGSIVTVMNTNKKLPVTVFINKKTPNILEPAIEARVSGSGTLFFGPVVIK